MSESKQPTREELIEASKPLLDFLNKYYHPHAYVVVTEGRAEVFEGVMAAPLPVRD